MTLSELIASAPCVNEPGHGACGMNTGQRHPECVAQDMLARRDEYLQALDGKRIGDWNGMPHAWQFPGYTVREGS